MRIFISHSSKDAELAKKVCENIESSGHSCFLAPRDIRSGCEYAEEIINGIDGSDVVLLLLSQAANDSPHVLREIERAVSKKKSVIVYKLEEVKLSKSMEYFLMTHQWLSSKGNDDFSEIILRINEYAAAHDMPEAPVVPKEKPAPENKPNNRRKIILIAAAAVILCAGIATGLLLSRRAPKSVPVHDAPQSPAAAEQSAPSGERQDAPSQPETPPPESEKVLSNPEPPHTESTPRVTDAAPPEDVPPPPPETTSSAAQTTIAPPAAETTRSTPEPQSAPEPEKTLAKAEIGDSLLFGTYNGEPIKWRVLRLSEDGTQAVVIAEDILTMKAFDAAEGGTFNKYEGEDYWSTKLSEIPGDIQRLIRGDNRWEYSNIRTWLNSDRENVQYSDQAPTSQAMTEKRNGYHTEPGFLNGFTKAERSALVETDITTNGTVTSDKVFLLSSAELEWLYEADVSVFAKPTAAAVEQDKSGWYKVDQDAYGVDDFFWWLRDAVPDNSCECYYINISYTDQRIASGSAGLEGYGIRPAVTLDLTAQPVIDALETAHETD